jgi:hypothetical protein
MCNIGIMVLSNRGNLSVNTSNFGNNFWILYLKEREILLGQPFNQDGRRNVNAANLRTIYTARSGRFFLKPLRYYTNHADWDLKKSSVLILPAE